MLGGTEPTTTEMVPSTARLFNQPWPLAKVGRVTLLNAPPKPDPVESNNVNESPMAGALPTLVTTRLPLKFKGLPSVTLSTVPLGVPPLLMLIIKVPASVGALDTVWLVPLKFNVVPAATLSTAFVPMQLAAPQITEPAERFKQQLVAVA